VFLRVAGVTLPNNMAAFCPAATENFAVNKFEFAHHLGTGAKGWRPPIEDVLIGCFFA